MVNESTQSGSMPVQTASIAAQTKPHAPHLVPMPRGIIDRDGEAEMHDRQLPDGGFKPIARDHLVALGEHQINP